MQINYLHLPKSYSTILSLPFSGIRILIVAPGLALGDGHLPNHTPHVTLGQVLVAKNAPDIEGMLKGLLPDYVQFKPANVELSINNSAH